MRRLSDELDPRLERIDGLLDEGEQTIVALRATVEAADGKTVWVAYAAAGPNWGKDYLRERTEYKGKYGETLHASRRLGLRAVVDGRVMAPKVESKSIC